MQAAHEMRDRFQWATQLVDDDTKLARKLLLRVLLFLSSHLKAMRWFMFAVALALNILIMATYEATPSLDPFTRMHAGIIPANESYVATSEAYSSFSGRVDLAVLVLGATLLATSIAYFGLYWKNSFASVLHARYYWGDASSSR